jgi:prepilin-type N-terminal cleavage/methylation domain-containing protein
MRRQNTTARAEQGFTLFEILVGLAISALIMLGLSSTMLSINRAWQQTTDAGEQRAMLVTGLRVARDDLSHVERMYDDNETPSRFLFSGALHDMIFPIVERDGHNTAGIYWVRLEVREVQGGVELVRSRAAFEPGKQDLAGILWADPVVLARGAFDISFGYLPPSSNASWDLAWPMHNQLPRQVRIDVVEKGGRPVTVPPVIVALRLAGELNCVQDEAQLCSLNSNGALQPPQEVQQ